MCKTVSKKGNVPPTWAACARMDNFFYIFTGRGTKTVKRLQKTLGEILHVGGKVFQTAFQTNRPEHKAQNHATLTRKF